MIAAATGLLCLTFLVTVVSAASYNSTELELLERLSRHWFNRTGNVDSIKWEVEGADQGGLANAAEGTVMLVMGLLGLAFNVLCITVLFYAKDLNFLPQYLYLLRSQTLFNLLYILTSTVITALPCLFSNYSTLKKALCLPWVFPFVQITMTASVYNTIALATERYLSIRDVNVTSVFPCKSIVILITVFSLVINIPRFFELREVVEEVIRLKIVNNTGLILHDIDIWTVNISSVKPTAEFYTVGYFLGYNVIFSFLVGLFIPFAMLTTLNLMIWCRLKRIWHNRSQLGMFQQQNVMVTFSLLLAVIMFVTCHSMKFVVSGYQLVDAIVTPGMPRTVWPLWVSACTFASHFLLALNAAINIMFFCVCDKHFLAAMWNMLRSCFLCPSKVWIDLKDMFGFNHL